MTTINKQHGFYGALAAHYDSPDHRNAIWDVTVKRLGQICPEKSANAEQTKNGQVVGISHRHNTTPHHSGQAYAVPVRNQERNA